MDITNTIQISDASQSPDILEWKKWQEEFVNVVEAKVNQNPSLLDSEMQKYIKRARFQVYNVFRAPHTACMMSQYVGYAIRVFADLERAIFKRRVDLKDYYHNMSELLAMYCDLRVNALLLYKDRLDEVRHQFLVMLRQFLANNVDYITNALLRIQRLKVSRLMFENMFKFVEKNANFEKAHTNCVTYCRYILFYRQWKKMYSDIMVLREISARAVERLKPPPNFRKHKLFEMLRPKNSAIPPNLTLFFLTAPINTNLAVDKFFSLDEKYAPAEAPAHDDIYEVVDLTDEVQSPKQEDESLERQQPQQEVQVMNRSISYNRPNDDTYNLTLSFNSMMNIDNSHHQTSTQQIDNINQSTSMQCTTSLSSYLHGNDQQPSWSPITRNLITNTNKDHQESIDAGIFSDRSSGNSPAYEMEVKDVNVITSNASISMTEKVITRVISSSCDKCGHKSSSSIVDVLPPPASFTQQIQTTKPLIPPSTQSKTSVIVILDDEEDVEQSHRNVKQVTLPTNVVIEEQTQQNCLQSEVLVPGDSDNDVIIVNNDCDNNQETSIIKIEEVTPPSSQQIDESNTSLPIESTTTGQKTNISNDRDATTTIKSSTATSELTQNVNVDDSTTTIQSSSATNELTQNVNVDDAVINDSNLVQEIDNRTLNIKKTNLKDVGVSTQDIMDSVEETHEHVLSDSSTQRIKRDNASKVRVMSVVDVTPSACVGNDGISNLQQASSSTTQVAKVLNDAETFTIDKPTVLGIQNDNVADIQSTMNVDVNNENVEEDIDTDMDTQHFVDQMFCSKPIESISNKNKTNKDISDNDNSNNDESHRELSAFLKSPPQSDPFFYGFSNSNTSGGGLLKSLSSNNNSLSSSTSSLFNNNNNNIDHNQCSIHLQNATRLTEEFVSTTRTRDTTFMKNTTNTNKTIKNISFSSSTNNKNASNNHKNTKSILKTSKKSQSTVNENNNSGKKKSVVLSKDSYTRYIHEDEIENENQPIIMKTSHASIHRKQQYGSSLPQYPQQKKGSIIIAENHYDKPEENIRRHSRYQDYPEYRHNSSHQHQHQENRRVLRQRSESRDRDPYSKYLHPTCQEPYQQPKDRENGRSLPRRRCRSISETRSESYNFSTKESPSPKRVRFDSFNENSRVTRSRSNDRNCRFEDNSTKQSVREQTNARNRVKTNSEEEKQLLYEKLRRKYNILKQVQIILNERNNLSLEAYQKKQMEEASRSNNKIPKTQRRIQRRKSVYYDIDSEINTDDITSRDSAEFPNELSNDHRKSRLRSRRNSNVNDTNIGQRRGRSRTRMTLDLTLNNIDSTEKSNDRLTPTNSEHINNDTTPTTTTENMYPSTTYFSTPVRIAEFVECLQASTTTTNSITPKSDEIHVPSIQSSIERLQNSLASPISLPASENTTTDSTFNDTNLNKKKYNSIKSGNLILSNVSKQLVNIFSDVTDNVQDSEDNDDNVQYDQEPEQSLDELSTDLNVERPILRTKGARKLLKDEINRPMRQCRRSSSTSNRIFSTDTSSTRRLRKTEYLKTFRHVTGDLEEDQSTPAMQDDEVTTSTPNTELTPSASTLLSTEVTTTDTYTTSTPLIVSESKLSWEHYINLSPEKQQVSIVDNNVDDDDESNPIYDQLSTIVKSSDLEKPADDQQIQINSVEEIDKSDKHDKPEILSSPINIAPIEQPIIDNSPLKHSNLDVVSDNKIDNKTEKLEPVVENSTTVVDSISTTNECTSTVPKLLPILSKNDEKKQKRTRKVTFVDKTDNINEILNSKLNDQVKTNNNKKNRKTINHLSPTLDNKIINDEQVVKITEIPNKNKKNNQVKSNKKTVNNNKNRITRITKETKPITKEIKPILKEIKSITKEIKSSKKDLSSSSKDASSKIRFFDLFEEFDHQQKNHLLIPNVRKRRLLSCTTTTSIPTPTSSSPLVNKSTVNDEDDDDISLAELKRRNVILVKKNVKHLNNKLNKRAGKSHKNCDINHVSGTSTNTTGTNSSTTGAIVLTLDEIETCDISVVSCEEVVGEGTILLNNANATKSSATATKPATASTATTTNKVNNVVNDT
ncbi:probable serine/threonine-protein kinase DDB_G0282963 [Chrysoperla carnea]|uniref:probable serine/threonine-protein kinase DDB_G0282963 n=1 Tax=Chrysoperla carnea TaxID=189513 RepID=UPI001D06DE7C|nr:probable serine/threonine-protein kinase DDB_G0282963 [Chrysoperla carnea]